MSFDAPEVLPPQPIKQTVAEPQIEWSCQSVQKYSRKEEQFANNIQVEADIFILL